MLCVRIALSGSLRAYISLTRRQISSRQTHALAGGGCEKNHGGGGGREGLEGRVRAEIFTDKENMEVGKILVSLGAEQFYFKC